MMKKVVSVLFAVLVLAFSSLPAMAAPSPTASKEYKVIVHNTKGGGGTYTIDVDKDGQYAKIKAHPKNGYEFVKWVIKGKYEITDGDLTDEELTLLLKGDVHATPYFKKIGGKQSSSTPNPSRNSSQTSPKTGDTAPYILFGAIAALAIAFTAVGIKLVIDRK